MPSGRDLEQLDTLLGCPRDPAAVGAHGRSHELVCAQSRTEHAPLVNVHDVDVTVHVGSDRRAVVRENDSGRDGLGIRGIAAGKLDEPGPVLLVVDQDQIARAVELGIGVSGPDQIEIVGPDRASSDYAARISDILAQG